MAMTSSGSMHHLHIAESRIRENLLRFDGRNDARVQQLLSEVPPFLRKAAILIGLLMRNGIIHVLLTVRSTSLRSHSGLVSFPGGKMDDTDTDLVHTALREAQEEIGLEADNVEVICTLAPMVVSPDYLTTPVVAIIKHEFEPVQNEDEVSDIFYLPLNRFLEDNDHEELISGGSDILIHYFNDEIDGKMYQTWGFTAMYCYAVATAIFEVARFNCLRKTAMSVDDPFRDFIIVVNAAFDRMKSSISAKL